MDLREPGAWVYLKAVVHGQAELDLVESLRVQHARALSLREPGLELMARQQLAEMTDRIEAALDRALRPWAGAEAVSRADVRSMEAKWEAAWGGKLGDPEMQTKIREACAQMLPAQKRPGPPTTRRA